MIAVRKYAVVSSSKGVVLSDLPFQPGQRVEVVVIAEEEKTTARLKELRELFQTTQALPQARAISEEEIAAEIAAYRASR